MIDYSIEIINNPAKLVKLVERLSAVSVFALDIETVDWWNRHQERIALIQIAFRTVRGVKVSVIDVSSPRLLSQLNGERFVTLRL